MRHIAILTAAAAVLMAPPSLAKPARTKAETANLAAVTAFYNAALNDKDAEKAAAYLGPRYVQHNPVAADGVEGFKGFIAMIKARFPQNRSEIRRSFVDGDTVVLHVWTRRTPEARGSAVVDIFRLEQGKIVEHWDVMQDVPEKTASGNPML